MTGPLERDDTPAFLAGGGEMGERIRAFDWARTSLGATELWPQSLRSAVSILLPSKAQIVLFWGSDLVTLYNDAYRPVLGAKHPHVLGLPAHEAWSEIWQTGLKDLFEGVLTTGVAYWASNRPFFLKRNGFVEETFFDVSYDPVRDESGKVGGIFCIVSETTARVLGERRLKTLRELAARAAGMKSAEDACDVAALTVSENDHDLPFVLLYLLDEDGRRATLAGSSGLVRGDRSSPVSIDLDDGTASWPFRQVVETGAAVEVADLPGKLGELPGGAWPEATQKAVVLPFKKPAQAKLAGFVVAGISPRLDFNDEYRGFLDLLAGQVAAAVANARAYEEEKKRAEALAELDRAKTAFFSNVSHEFRTPLTLMLGPVEDLLARSHADLSPAVAHQLDVVHRNGLRLLRLVNTLLDFSRIEAGRVRAIYQPTDLAAFTSELASVFRAAIERAGLRLVVDCPKLAEPVFVDRDMWEKIVLNLLSNAFKFTFEGEIVVTLRAMGTAAELRVRDTGTGIPAAEMPRLFERFHRVQSAQGRTHEGSGIGLALVQELVKLHGGTIAAESAIGKGTTFTITLPFGSAHLPSDQIGESRAAASAGTRTDPYVEEALLWLHDEHPVSDGPASEVPARFGALPVPSLPQEQDPDDHRPRVLVADDNADMRDYLVRLLAERYAVKSAADGEAAATAAREQPPDLVLSDVMMPRLDGFGLLCKLRADPRTREVPVILLSARAGEESSVEGLEAGADDYLIKPFSARELLARVGAHLQMARLRREAGDALRESEARFRHMADHAPVMVWVTEPDGSCSYLSKTWYDFTGQTPATALGFGWVDAVHPDDRARVRAAFLAANARRETFRMEYRLCGRDGEYRWVLDAATPRMAADGALLGYVGSVIDITERKRDEEALRAADRRKDEFLAILAHELRGPLAPLRNMLEIMKRSDGSGDLIQQVRCTMERQLGQLVRLVDDLLDVNRITRDKLELRKEPVEFVSLIRETVETCRPLAEGRGIEIDVTLPLEPIYLHADPVRLAQVLDNIFNNALKYTDAKGHVWLTAERQGSDVLVKVKDSGLGIPADKLASIFELFTQVARSLERAQGGLGIGLTLVKRLVEMHGGTVEAFSEGPGRGSEFTVRLPVLIEEGAHGTSGPAIKDLETISRRILIVDDNRDSAETLAMLLQVTGNDVHMAHDGLEAVTAAEQFRPDVVLLDIGLPKLHGFDAARRIREQPWGKRMVLVAVTGWGQEEDRRKSLDAGFNAHMVKPVDLDELMQLLSSLSSKERAGLKGT